MIDRKGKDEIEEEIILNKRQKNKMASYTRSTKIIQRMNEHN